MKQTSHGCVLAALIVLIAPPAWAQAPVSVRTAMAAVTLAAPASPAAAQDPDPATTGTRPVSVTVGADIPTDYYFRGYIQEAEGFIIQPYVDVGINLSEIVSVHVGWWNSAHSSDTTGTLYESDPWASVNVAAGSWSASALYTLYTYPSDLFEEIHELAFTLSHASVLAPSITIATEVKNENLDDAGNTYLQLGIAPAIPVEGPVSLSVPVAVGLSLKDYYTSLDAELEPQNEVFGYARAGVAASVALPRGFEVHAGFDLLFLRDELQWDDEAVKPVFTVGGKFTY
jgi:hypothetical protein